MTPGTLTVTPAASGPTLRPGPTATSEAPLGSLTGASANASVNGPAGAPPWLRSVTGALTFMPRAAAATVVTVTALTSGPTIRRVVLLPRLLSSLTSAMAFGSSAPART